jgi:quercetin dioxygenase-like cupin family protein
MWRFDDHLRPAPSYHERQEERRTARPRSGGKAMRRIIMLPVILVLGVVFILGGALAPRLAAQDATPAAVAQIELAPGVVAEVFAGAPSAVAEGQTVYLARFTFDPGSEIFPHSHPGTIVLGVESGTFGWTLHEGTAHVVRGAAAGGTAVEDVTEPGTEVILNVGDAIFYEDDVVHTARGEGEGPAVVLGTLVLETGQALLMPADMEMEATPAA